MSNAPHVETTEPEPGIITVTVDRGERCNAITPAITQAYWNALNALMDRDDLRCMVLTARGEYFTSGIDLQFGAGSRPANPETADLHPGWSYRRNYRSHHALYDEMEATEKPIIMAVQGTILGGGVEMAASCDFRFCTPRAEWGLPEIRLGALAGSGGTTRLTRLVGPHWAKWMAMAGQRVTAEEALRIGLVHRIFPEEHLLEEVYRFCRELIAIRAEALGLAKLVVDIAADVQDRTVQRHVDRIANTQLSNGSPEILERSARYRHGGHPVGWRQPVAQKQGNERPSMG